MYKLDLDAQMRPLRLIGLQPVIGDPSGSGLKSKAQLALMMAVFLINSVFTSITLVEPGVPAEDKSLAVSSIFVGIMGAVKALVFHINQSEIRLICRGLNDEKNQLAATTKKLYTLLVVVMTFAVLSGIVYMIHPLATAQFEKLPMSFHVPFDISDPWAYAAAYFLSGLSLYNSAVCHVVTDSALVILAGRFCNRIVSLSQSFATIDRHNQNETLRQCIQEHCELLRLLKSLRKIASVTYFVHVFSSATLVCMAAYATLRPETQKQTGKHVTFLFAALMQLFVYCYTGQQITDRSAELHNACYSSNWYNCSINTRKSLAIVLTITQRSIVLKGCHVVEISLRMFLKVITESYSYLMILLSLM